METTAEAHDTDRLLGWALLAMRLALGALFLAQGTTKWGWFGGSDPPGMSGLEHFLQVLGYDSRTALSWLLTVTELTTGVLLIAGLFTPLAVAGVIGIAINGAFVLSWQGGFIVGYGGWILYMAVAVALALVGPGLFALDHLAPWRAVGWVRRWLVGPRGGVFGIAVGLAVGVGIVTAPGPGFGGAPRTGPVAGVGGSGDQARWCQLAGEVRQTLDAGGSPSGVTLDDFADAAPVGVRVATQIATEAFKGSIPDAFERPEVGAAVGDIEAFAASNCR